MRPITLLLLILLLGCAVPRQPKQRIFNDSITVNSDFEETWLAVLNLLADNGWIVENMKKESGFIVSNWLPLNVPYRDQLAYADCGIHPIEGEIHPTSFRLNIFIKLANSVTSVRLRSSFRGSLLGEKDTVNCFSKGHLERVFFSSLFKALP